MNDSINVISIKDLQNLFPRSFGDYFKDNFFLANTSFLDFPELREKFQHPYRLDAYMAIFCFEGELTVEINLKPYHITKGSVIINVPGNVWRICDISPAPPDARRFVLIAVSRDFLSISRMNYVHLYRQNLSAFNNPCFTITESEQEVLNKYYELAHELRSRNISNIRQTLWGLVSSCLYYFGGIWAEKISKVVMPRKPGHHKVILERFLDLVVEYHDRERGMAFYASKLCITPKYLSSIIRSVSGRSGPEWIDSYVLLEAKNMLKYTDMPIKQIVAALHFDNPSTFFKFFRAHTGMTPSEFRG